LISFICVLEWSLELLYEVWWLKTWMHWSVVVGGIYSPNHQNDHWWRLLSYGAPDSPMRHRKLSGAPATSPGCWVSTVRASDNGATGQSGGAPDRSCSLSGAPSGACSDLCARRCTVHCSIAVDRWRGRPLLRLPDYPVLHRTIRWIIAERPPRIPERGKFGVELPGAPDTVRWHTGQSGAPDQGCLWVVFCSFYLNPFLDFLLVCVEPLAHVKLTI
jgi:hypothetical protein